MDNGKTMMKNSSNKFPFDLPSPKGSSVSPKWDGRNFVIGDKSSPVLEYSENFAGWSDDLSALHEEAVGEGHPIDFASRHDALLHENCNHKCDRKN